MYSWVNVQCKRDWRVEICTLRAQEEQGLAPFTLSTPLPHSPGVLRAQFISNLGPEWTGPHHSKEGFQVSERGIEKGARGLARGRKEQGDCAMHIDNLYMCT
jgi:hypothetical protein